MISSVTLQEAQATLPDLIRQLAPGAEVVITENSQPVAKLVAPSKDKPRAVPGRCQEMLTILSEDEGHLEHFKDYMP